MRVQDYPISTPYGYVPGYPLNNGFHLGIDYSCPTGTALIVNGVTIALTNNTGASTGSHCHVGKYVNGQVQNPGVGNGFSFNSAVVYDTGSDATNGNYVRVTGDGALWNYLHLEKVLVTKGQVLKGGDMPSSADKVDETSVRLGYNGMLFRDPSADEINQWVGKETQEVFDRTLIGSPEYAQIRAQWEAGKSSNLEPVTEQLYRKK